MLAARVDQLLVLVSRLSLLSLGEMHSAAPLTKLQLPRHEDQAERAPGRCCWLLLQPRTAV